MEMTKLKQIFAMSSIVKLFIFISKAHSHNDSKTIIFVHIINNNTFFLILTHKLLHSTPKKKKRSREYYKSYRMMCGNFDYQKYSQVFANLWYS